jgi:hypothetical protein
LPSLSGYGQTSIHVFHATLPPVITTEPGAQSQIPLILSLRPARLYKEREVESQAQQLFFIIFFIILELEDVGYFSVMCNGSTGHLLGLVLGLHQ